MGLAASQARFLALTARISNNEYQAQQINQQRLNLADNQLELSKKYQEKISNRILYFIKDPNDSNTLGNMKQLNYWNLVNPSGTTDNQGNLGLGYRLVDINGNIIVPNYPGNNTDDGEIGAIINKYNVTDDVLDTQTLYKKLQSGEWVMKAKRTYDDSENPEWYEIPLDEADFIVKMRGKNPDDETDTEYWELYNKLVEKVDGNYQPLTFENLTTMSDLEIRLYDSEGKILVTKIPDDDQAIVTGKYNVDPHCIDGAYLEEKLRNGEWFIQTPANIETSDDEWVSVPWTSIPNIYDALNSADDAEAESEYNYLISKFQKEDKILEMRLKQLETEHNAMQTEIDSVKKVIDKNIENSFKTFA